MPLDHDDPDGPAIDIGVSRVAATGDGTRRQGVLVVNLGGPGAAAVGAMGNLARRMPTEVRAAYDIVGFDIRGRGTSTRLDCVTPAGGDPAPRPDPQAGEAGMRAHLDALRRFAENCGKAAPALVPEMTTRNIARDLDLVRSALGEEHVNLLGYSYGSYLGAVYGSLFPGRVRRMLFDGVVDPTRVWYGTGALQAPAFAARHHAFAAWAAAHDDRYHLGGTAEEVLVTWESVRDGLATTPAGGAVGSAEFDDLTLGALYATRDWPRFAGALAAYRAGDVFGLREMSAGSFSADTNFESVFQAVTCADAPAPADPQVYARDMERALAAHGRLGAAIAAPGACLYLQSNREPPPVIDGAGLPAVLMIQSAADPATPYDGALRMRAALPGSRMVTVRDDGDHGQYLTGNACVDGHGTRYLVDGTLPAPGTECPGAPVPGPGAARAATTAPPSR